MASLSFSWMKSREFGNRLLTLGIAVSLFLLFLAACWQYAQGLNLWGDETFSLLSAREPWNPIPGDAHLPTYYWLLHLLVDWVNGNELALRLIHSIPFGLGILLGLLTLKRTFRDARIAWASTLLAALLPEYIFYGTNIRMYAWVFLGAMAFIDAVSRILATDLATDQTIHKDIPQESAAVNRLVWLFCTALMVIVIDYGGWIYYSVGLLMLLVQARLCKQYRPLGTALIPLGLVGLLLMTTSDQFSYVLGWDIERYQGLTGGGLLSSAKWLYLVCRPVLDLIYPAPLPLLLAIGLPLLLMALIFTVAIKIVPDMLWPPEPPDPNWPWQVDNYRWLWMLALVWVPFIPFGATLPRLFLPSQLLMVALLLGSIGSANRGFKVLGLMAIGLLFAVNLHQAIRPTYKLYGLIPFETIAADIANFSQSQNVQQVWLSDNSLNTLSIKYYLEKMPDAAGLEVKRVPIAVLPDWLAVTTEPCIWVSHMSEDLLTEIPDAVKKELQPLQNYVSLADLPYNPLWKRRFQNNTTQTHAVQTYLANS